MLIFCLSIVCLFIPSIAQRWYYTGKYNSHQSNDIRLFQGDLLDISSLLNSDFTSNHEQLLFSGGLLLSPFDGDEEYRLKVLNFEVHNLINNLTSNGQDCVTTDIKSLNIYKLLIANNYSTEVSDTGNSTKWEILQAEIGLLDPITRMFKEKKWDDILQGFVISARVIVDGKLGHEILLTKDVFGRCALMAHRWFPIDFSENIDLEGTINDLVEINQVNSQQKKLRIMTYNLWHNNPPSWLYHDKKSRWERYIDRIKHFASIIAEEDPDIITMQEVRIDSSFYSMDGKMPMLRNKNNSLKYDSGSQVDHLLHYLQEIRSLKGLPHVDYQVFYHPAMLIPDRPSKEYRNEEGLMTLSKFPVSSMHALFLPREVGNPSDDHQRLGLSMNIDFPVSEFKNINITVLTTHQSLFGPSRIAGIRKIQDYFLFDPVVKNSAIQILTGDMNAEPQDPSIQILLNDEHPINFIDSWDFIHTRNKENEPTGYTFPASNPIKRIDFIFVRNNTNNIDNKYAACVQNSYIVGKEPTENTAHLVGSREGLGMNDLDSPVWASDHFALVTDLLITTPDQS